MLSAATHPSVPRPERSRTRRRIDAILLTWSCGQDKYEQVLLERLPWSTHHRPRQESILTHALSHALGLGFEQSESLQQSPRTPCGRVRDAEAGTLPQGLYECDLKNSSAQSAARR